MSEYILLHCLIQSSLNWFHVAIALPIDLALLPLQTVKVYAKAKPGNNDIVHS